MLATLQTSTSQGSGEQHPLYNYFDNAEYGFEEDQEIAGSHSVNYCRSHTSS